jgi:hypothetical protein
MNRKSLATICLAALITSPAAGFDTFWHSEASRKVGDYFGFSEDAWKIMQLGNFAPDLFGPVSQFASEHLPGEQFSSLSDYTSKNAQVMQAAIFLHFDNLNQELKQNSQFDALFRHLLESTQDLLATYNKLPQVDERTRKVLVLITLGASLHAVQDFYSHSDWVHNDFNKTAVKMVKLPDGSYRAPTWFEFRARFDDPEHWAFHVNSGIYPPVVGALNTHTHMNHDNSQLIYKEYESPGQPLLSQAKYHNFGSVPAQEQNPAAVLAHQQLAFNTAVAGSVEWVQKIEQSGAAKTAIDSAKDWHLKLEDPRLAKELEGGMATELGLSCAAGKWDGEDPPAERGVLCRSVLERKLNPTSNISQLEAEVIGLAANLAMPFALKFTGKFWDVHGQYHILQKLAEHVGSGSGHYKLGK